MWLCLATIRNNTIYDNADFGLAYCEGVIENNVIWNNKGDGVRGADGSIQNCIIWGNSMEEGSQIVDSVVPSYCCIEGWDGAGVGNLAVEPRFVDPDNGDFHLLSASPCIDAGGAIETTADPPVDFEGDPRPTPILNRCRGDGSGFDIGADEYFLAQHKPSDVNFDREIGFRDLFVFQDDWHAYTSGFYDTDLNDDDDIDALDLLVLEEDWRHTSGP